MDLPDFFIIAALVAIARWVIRSIREPGMQLPDADGKPRPPQPVRPGQKTVRKVELPAAKGHKRATDARRPATAAHHADSLPAWFVLLDVSQDAPRSEIQAAAKRRIAQAISSGDHAAVAHITRAVATGLKHQVLRTADELPRGRRDP